MACPAGRRALRWSCLIAWPRSRWCGLSRCRRGLETSTSSSGGRSGRRPRSASRTLRSRTRSLESSARARRPPSACITTGITTTNGFSSTSPRRPRSAGRRVSSKAAPAVRSRGEPSRDSSGREAVGPQVAKGSAQSSLGPQEGLPGIARAWRRHRVRVDHRDREGADGKAQALPGDRLPPTPGEIAIDHGKGQDRGCQVGKGA